MPADQADQAYAAMPGGGQDVPARRHAMALRQAEGVEHYSGDIFDWLDHRPPLSTAPVADSQRLKGPLFRNMRSRG
jgi:hypothetical protein